MPDLDRLTKPEVWHAAFAAGRAEAAAEKPGWKTSEFWLTVVTVAFASWVGYRLVLDASLELERGAAIVGLVIAAAWKYTDVRKTLKSEGKA
jgi:hypothetical protein